MFRCFIFIHVVPIVKTFFFSKCDFFRRVPCFVCLLRKVFFQRSTHYCKLHVESFLLWNHSSYRYSDVRAILLGNFQQIKLFSGIRFLLCQWYCHRHPVTSEEIRQSALHWSRRTPRWVRREWSSSDGAKKLKYFWTRSNIERFLWIT